MGRHRAHERIEDRMMRSMLALCLALAAGAAWAQAFPSRPVHFAVAFSPGGIADTIARSVGQKMSEHIGQPVVVETKSGAGGLVGAKYVAATAPDGYMLLVTTTSLAINANGKEGVNPVTQLTPVAIAASTPTIFAVNGEVAAKDLMDFVRNVKGGRFTFASAGIGSAEHLAGEYIFRAVPGLDATHVPFQGGAPVNTAIISKQVDIASTTLPTALAYIRGQTMRVLAVASHRRMAQLPQVPTLAEVGFPDYESASWIAFFGPAKLPDGIAQMLNAEINAALGQPDVRERLSTIGLEPRTMTQPQFADYVKAEVAQWGDIIRKTGITPN
jgi:tripartite-type tricarboxylate transporter receptor subunit TctC